MYLGQLFVEIAQQGHRLWLFLDFIDKEQHTAVLALHDLAGEADVLPQRSDIAELSEYFGIALFEV